MLGGLANMHLTDKEAAARLAAAFLRKRVSSTRFDPRIQRAEETSAFWIFDFFHPSSHVLRRKGVPFGARIAVSKRSGKARHFASLIDKRSA
jgi:hypothetical protein